MPKTKQQKEQIITALTDKIQRAKSLVIASQEGLTVADSQALRQKCQEQQVDFVSVKKTLLKLALKNCGYKDVEVKGMVGSLAVALSNDDEVAPAKILNDFAKTHEQVAFRGGMFEGKFVGVAEIKQLALLPSKLELWAKVVGSLCAPLSGLVNVLAGNLRGLVNVLQAIKNNKS